MTPEDDKPPEHPTTRLVPPTEAEIDHARIGKLEERMAVLEAATASNHDEVMAAMDNMGERLFQGMQSHAVLADKRFQLLEARSNAHSERVRGVSENDLAQQSQLAGQLVINQQTNDRLGKLEASSVELHTKSDAALTILARVDAAVKSPMVQRVAKAIGLLILGYAAAKGIKLP